MATKERVFGRVVTVKQLENKEERDDERGKETGGGEDRVATDVAITALVFSFFFLLVLMLSVFFSSSFYYPDIQILI